MKRYIGIFLKILKQRMDISLFPEICMEEEFFMERIMRFLGYSKVLLLGETGKDAKWDGASAHLWLTESTSGNPELFI